MKKENDSLQNAWNSQHEHTKPVQMPEVDWSEDEPTLTYKVPQDVLDALREEA